jgi:2-keto-4-pentenoate hydratase/2-oxohepta-3-ene-1,7-dioic acid hydratase in catechol pathway
VNRPGVSGVVPHLQVNNSAAVRTRRNGVLVQESDPSQLILTVPTLVALISAFTTLQPGDVILTGTPGGTDNSEVPKRFLTAGDQVTVEISGVGTIDNTVVAETTATGLLPTETASRRQWPCCSHCLSLPQPIEADWA